MANRQKTPTYGLAIANRISRDLPDGAYVNLGIGLPLMIADVFNRSEKEVVFHCENGFVGVGPYAPPGQEDKDRVLVGRQHVMEVPGASFVSHADSFAMIRGGHLDIAVMGAYEVSASGDLANWCGPDGIPAVGGAMDLAHGAKTVWVAMPHRTKAGKPKIVEECHFPLTAEGVVERVYTDLATFQIEPSGLKLIEAATGVTVDHILAHTPAPVRVADEVGVF